MTVDARPATNSTTLEQLSPAQRRLRLGATLVRPVLGGVLLVVLYYLLPLDRAFGLQAAILFLLGLAGVAVILFVQIRGVIGSEYPRLRAIGALAVSIPTFLVLFATVYYLIAQGNGDAFTEPLTKTDSLYFTVTVFSTVGFGDIAPKLQAARVVTMLQMIGDLILLGLIGKVLLGAVAIGLDRTQHDQPRAPR